MAICRTSHSLTEPVPEMAMRSPLRSATVLIGESAKVVIEMLRGSVAKAAIARAGSPLATKARSAPLVMAKSTLPAVIA